MKNRTIKGVVFFGSLAILSIIAIQAFMMVQTWNIEEEKFEEKVRIALINVANDLADVSDYPLPSKDMVNQLSPDYFVVNINNVINANNLDYFLQKEIEAVALSEDFEYWIYDCTSQDMMYGNYISYPKGVTPASEKRDDLPTYDESEYYFGIRFPNRTSYLLGNMRIPLVFSFILFITIIFFLYSIFVILRQKALSEMQKDFINNMTHEFKTPISTIKISSDFFLRQPSIKEDKRLKKYAQIIKEQNERLNNQVENVLQIAKIDQESFKLDKEVINLNLLIQEIILSTEVKVNQLNGCLKTDLQAPISLVKADKLHLSNILHNLLDNAIKYCKHSPEITIRTKIEGKKLLLAVKDKGVGIKKEYQSKVFKKFFRVPTGNVHNVKGFGLGLFYIKKICDAHGWKVRLDSEENIGTKISILFPIHQPQTA